MKPAAHPRLTLQAVMLTAIAASVCMAFLATLVVTYHSFKRSLIDSALSANEAYTQKIATAVRLALDSDLSRLRYSAAMIGEHPDLVPVELMRLARQDNAFSSVLTADKSGVIQQTYPLRPALLGLRLKTWTPQARQAEQVSHVFESLSGNTAIFVSVPVPGPDGTNIGIIGATIYLQASNPVFDMIESHRESEGVAVALMDGEGRYVYRSSAGVHRDADEQLPGKGFEVMSAGSRVIVDASGKEWVEGFAPVGGTNWAVLSRQSTKASDKQVGELISALWWRLLPLVLFGFALMAGLTLAITRPLQKLARVAMDLCDPNGVQHIDGVKAWYSEASRIKHALRASSAALGKKIGSLNAQVRTDALTGLANRRAMNEVIAQKITAAQGFAVVSVDIDHFKRVNDTYGHGAGDCVLAEVASLLRSGARQEDLVFRAGGEEFLIVLPEAALQVAHQVALRVRNAVSDAQIAYVGHVTVSAGVAVFRSGCDDGQSVLERADKALYEAKRLGRDRVCDEREACTTNEPEPI